MQSKKTAPWWNKRCSAPRILIKEWPQRRLLPKYAAQVSVCDTFWIANSLCTERLLYIHSKREPAAANSTRFCFWLQCLHCGRARARGAGPCAQPLGALAQSFNKNHGHIYRALFLLCRCCCFSPRAHARDGITKSTELILNSVPLLLLLERT